MKRLFFEKVPAWLCIVIFFGLVLHTPITVWVSSQWPTIGLLAKAWKEVLLFIICVLLIADMTCRHQWRRWLSDRLIQWVLLFVAWHGVVMMIAPQSLLATVAGVMIDLRFVAFFVAVYVFVQNYPHYRNHFKRALLSGAVIVIGFAIAQFVLPRDILATLGYSKQTIAPYQTVDSNESFVRINSTLRGPNPLGAYASVVVIGVVAYGTRRWRELSLKQRCGVMGCLIAALGALAQSYSRAAWLATTIGVIIVLAMATGRTWRRFVQAHTRKMGLVAGTLIIAVVGILIVLPQTNTFKTIIFHDDAEHGPVQTSDSDRMTSLQIGMQQVVERPFGVGIGSTGSASVRDGRPTIIENQYLFVAHEIGVIGLGIFVALMTSILVQSWDRQSSWLSIASFASGIGLNVIGLFLPVFVDDVVSMLWWGLAGLVITENTNDKPNTKTA